MLVNCFFAFKLLVHCKGVQLSQLHQQSCWATAWLVHCKGVQLSPLGFAACQSKNCTNRAVGLLLGWCTPGGAAVSTAPTELLGCCLVGALETSAPPGLLHEHLLHLATCCAHDVDAALKVLHAYAAEGVYSYILAVVGCSERVDCCRVGVFLAEHNVYV